MDSLRHLKASDVHHMAEARHFAQVATRVHSEIVSAARDGRMHVILNTPPSEVAAVLQGNGFQITQQEAGTARISWQA